MTVEDLNDDFGITARRVAWVAEQLDDLLPGWAEHVDPGLFERGEIETNPIGQVRASVPEDDPRWVVLAEMSWREHPMSEEWRPLWRAAWQTETLKRGLRAQE